MSLPSLDNLIFTAPAPQAIDRSPPESRDEPVEFEHDHHDQEDSFDRVFADQLRQEPTNEAEPSTPKEDQSDLETGSTDGEDSTVRGPTDDTSRTSNKESATLVEERPESESGIAEFINLSATDLLGAAAATAADGLSGEEQAIEVQQSQPADAPTIESIPATAVAIPNVDATATPETVPPATEVASDEDVSTPPIATPAEQPPEVVTDSEGSLQQTFTDEPTNLDQSSIQQTPKAANDTTLSPEEPQEGDVIEAVDELSEPEIEHDNSIDLDSSTQTHVSQVDKDNDLAVETQPSATPQSSVSFEDERTAQVTEPTLAAAIPINAANGNAQTDLGGNAQEQSHRSPTKIQAPQRASQPTAVTQTFENAAPVTAQPQPIETTSTGSSQQVENVALVDDTPEITRVPTGFQVDIEAPGVDGDVVLTVRQRMDNIDAHLEVSTNDAHRVLLSQLAEVREHLEDAGVDLGNLSLGFNDNYDGDGFADEEWYPDSDESLLDPNSTNSEHPSSSPHQPSTASGINLLA